MPKILIFTFILFISIPSFGTSLKELECDEATPVKSTAKVYQPLEVKKIRLHTGVELEYVEQGNQTGTPVIFLHGLSDSWHSFQSALVHLPSSIHSFALSQRGHGDSDRPANNYTPAHFAEDVAAFVKQKNLGRAVIVGHSMGGLNALQFAISYPELISGLVVVSSDPGFRDNPGMPEFYEQVSKMNSFDRAFMKEFQGSTLIKPIDSAYFEVLVDEGMKVPVHVFQAALKGIIETDLSEKVKSIKVPTLVLWGEKDGFCGRSGQDILDQNIEKSTLIVYRDTGHALHWENPETFSNHLVEFISEQRSVMPTKKTN